jgi:hypothetical protein
MVNRLAISKDRNDNRKETEKILKRIYHEIEQSACGMQKKKKLYEPSQNHSQNTSAT